MNRLFDNSNPVMKALGKLFDIGWLSIIYAIFCIPVITIGPATTALYYTSIKVLRKERGYVWTEFWGCFKANFKSSVMLGLGFTVIYILLAFNISAAAAGTEGFGGYLYGAYLGILIVTACLNCYMFPILSRFDLSIVRLFRLSFYMVFRHFQFTIVLLATVLIGIAGAYCSVVFNFPIIILVVPGGISMLYTFPMEYLMKKYMPKSEPIVLEDGEQVKPWYED